MSERLVMGILSVVDGRTAFGGAMGIRGSTFVLVFDEVLPISCGSPRVERAIAMGVIGCRVGRRTRRSARRRQRIRGREQGRSLRRCGGGAVSGFAVYYKYKRAGTVAFSRRRLIEKCLLRGSKGKIYPAREGGATPAFVSSGRCVCRLVCMGQTEVTQGARLDWGDVPDKITMAHMLNCSDVYICVPWVCVSWEADSFIERLVLLAEQFRLPSAGVKLDPVLAITPQPRCLRERQAWL